MQYDTASESIAIARSVIGSRPARRDSIVGSVKPGDALADGTRYAVVSRGIISSRTRDFAKKNFLRHNIWIIETLSTQLVDKGGRSEREKLDRSRSTEFTAGNAKVCRYYSWRSSVGWHLLTAQSRRRRRNNYATLSRISRRPDYIIRHGAGADTQRSRPAPPEP